MYNGFLAGATSSSGAEVLGIGHLRAGFVGRGVLLDVARHLGVEWLDPFLEIGPDLLDEVCAQQRLELRSGDIVLIRTGALGRWWSLESDTQRLDWFSGSPGPGIACLEWFHRNEIAAGAADGSYAFLLVAQPLNLPRALGSPLNPIAIK